MFLKGYLGGLFMLCLLSNVSSSQSFDCERCARGPGNCVTVKGVSRVTVMSKGYNPIVTIPPWACYVNITEAGTSNNHLALKSSDDKYILNGRWTEQIPGSYEGVGTTFAYRRSEFGCPGECIRSVGPTTDTVIVQLLYHDKSPGVYYSYVTPRHLNGHNTAPSQLNRQLGNAESPSAYRRLELRESETRYQFFTSSVAPIEKHERRASSFPELSPLPRKTDLHRSGPIFSSEFKHSHKRNRQNSRRRHDSQVTNPDRQELREVTFSRGVDDTSVRQENADNAIPDSVPKSLGTIIETDGDSDDNLIPTDGSGDSLIAARDLYAWVEAGLTNCTRLCGGGVQETMYVCVHLETFATVDDTLCDDVIKPEVQYSVCNPEPCTQHWKEDTWSPCSSTCGKGRQSRDVTCQQRLSATDSQVLPDDYCTTRKPITERDCYGKTCYKWVDGDWSDCSAQCGEGTRRRHVHCRNEAGTVVNDNYCDQSRPLSEESCDMGSCTRHWFYSRWTDECSADCGSGIVTRSVHCATDTGRVLDDSQCDVTSKPTNQKPCKMGTTCGGNWFTGSWSQCSQSCGAGVKQRYVVCMRNVGEQLVLTADNTCVADDKPATRGTCTHEDCGNMWYTTEWSKCSRSCGGGRRTRSVQCIGDETYPSTLCMMDKRPETSQSCNTDRCWQPAQPVRKGCEDQYPNCKVVVSASLCRYPYYQRKCCNSCSNSGRIYSRK